MSDTINHDGLPSTDHHTTSGPDDTVDSNAQEQVLPRLTAGLFIRRLFADKGNGVADTNFTKVATIASHLVTALRLALQVSDIQTHTLSGCILQVIESEVLKTRMIGAGIYLDPTTRPPTETDVPPLL